MRVRELALCCALAALAACGRKNGDAGHDHDDAHDHPAAPHGGEILELAGGAAHLELIHDHEGGNVTVYVLGADLRTPVAVEAPIVNLVTKDGPVQFALIPVNPRPDGKSDAWKGSHEGLKSDPWDGRIRVVIDGKTYQSPLEGEAHAHK